MKRNKVSCFVVLAMAIVFAIVGVVMLLLPEPTSPVTVSSTPIARKSGANVNLQFTLKNESEEDVNITYIEVTVAMNSGTEYAGTKENFTIAAGETYSCRYSFESAGSPKSVTEI